MPSKPPASSTNFTPLLARCGHFCGYPRPASWGWSACFGSRISALDGSREGGPWARERAHL